MPKKCKMFKVPNLKHHPRVIEVSKNFEIEGPGKLSGINLIYR